MKKIKKPIDWKIIVGAIAGLTLIELVAMHYGINGTMRTFIVGAICALAGLSLPQIKFKKI